MDDSFYCAYCQGLIPEERVLRGLRSNTPARYCGKPCYTRAKNARTRFYRSERARINPGEVTTAILEGQRAPAMPPAYIRANAQRFGKTLSQVASEAGMPSTYPLYSYMNGKQATISPVTRMRLHLYFTLLEKERYAREHHPTAC